MNENQWDVSLLNTIVTLKGHFHLTLRGRSPWWSETYQCLIGDSLGHLVSKDSTIPSTINELPGLHMSETEALAFTNTQMLQHLPFLVYNAFYRATLGKLNNIGPKCAFQIVKDAGGKQESSSWLSLTTSPQTLLFNYLVYVSL